MATKLVIKDPVLTIDGNDISTYVSSLTLNAEIEEQDGTAFGDGVRDYEAGLESNSAQITIKHADAMSALEGILWPLRSTKVILVARFKAAAVGTDNPSYTATVLVGSLPLGGQVGSIMESSVTWRLCSTITRATT